MRILLLCLALVGTAAAEPRRFALEALHVSGNPTAAERQLLDERVWSAVELLVTSGNDELIHIEDMQRAVATEAELAGCAEARCRLRLGELLTADRVLAVTIVRSGPTERGNWQVHLEQLAVAPATPLPSSDVVCKGCTASGLVGDLSHAIEKMVAAPGPSGSCRVLVTTTPGALVAVDGVVLGVAPFTHAIAAGRPTISATMGALSAQRQVECVAGDVDVPLILAENVSSRPPTLKIIGGVLVGLGVAGVVAGGYDFATDGNGTCNRMGQQRRCPQVYDTAGAGGALIAVGVVAVVAGAVTLIVDAYRKPRRVHASLSETSFGGSL